MKRIKIALIVSVLSLKAFGQAYNCDSSCFTPFNPDQNKAQTVYGSNNGTFTESRNASCPVGYSGSMTQSRNVSVYNGSYSYGPWQTTSSSCQPVVQTGKWIWLGWIGSGGQPMCIDSPALVNQGACSPVGYKCMFLDDMTSKIGQFQCK